jgi:hypothetical protein
MLNATRHNDEFAFFNPFVMIAEIHAKASFDDQKHFVFLLVMMSDEFALKSDQLEMLPI